MPQRLAVKRARRLRSDQTRAESHLWKALRANRLGDWHWRRQIPVGPFIVDFLCSEASLVVELDGSQHVDAVAYDDARTRYLAAKGLRVIRFWNSVVLEGRSEVCDAIINACGGARDERR